MTDIALDERAKFAAQLRNAANEMRAEDHNGWPVLCDIVADYLDVSPAQAAPAPAQVTDAMATAFREHYELATGQCLDWQGVYNALEATLPNAASTEARA